MIGSSSSGLAAHASTGEVASRLSIQKNKQKISNSGQHMSFQQTKPGMYKGSWFEASLIHLVMNELFVFTQKHKYNVTISVNLRLNSNHITLSTTFILLSCVFERQKYSLHLPSTHYR